MKNYLKNYEISIFQGFTENELEEMEVCGCVREKRYEKDSLIFHAGEKVQELGIVLQGSVNVENIDLWGNKSILSNIPKGHAFAETYAICKIPMMVDVAAGENCQVLFVNTEKLLVPANQKCSWYSRLLYNFLMMSTKKNLALSSRIFCTSSKSIRSRVMTYLSGEAVKTGKMEVTIPFDRQQMADYLNVERSALSKELGKMRQEGILDFRKNKFRLFQLEEG